VTLIFDLFSGKLTHQKKEKVGGWTPTDSYSDSILSFHSHEGSE